MPGWCLVSTVSKKDAVESAKAVGAILGMSRGPLFVRRPQSPWWPSVKRPQGLASSCRDLLRYRQLPAATGGEVFSSAKSLVATGNSSSKGDIVTLDPYGVFIGQLVR